MSKSVQLRRPTKSERIREAIRSWIDEQSLQPGDRILGQNALAEHFGSTVVTVSKALAELSAERVVHRINGKGTFVGPEPAGSRVRDLCLVLPGRRLDDPQHNPVYWPQVQCLYRAFLHAVGDRWRFSTMVVEPDADLSAVVHDVSRHDAVFFHHTKQPRVLWRRLVEQAVVPTVAFGLPDPDVPGFTIDHDVVEGVRCAVRHLAALGYRRIGFIGSRYPWGRYWLEGYRAGLADVGLACDPQRIARVGETREDGRRGAELLLERGLPCDVVFVDSDMRALGALETLRQAGVRVPDDIGVMGYDGLDHAVHQPPFLTSFSVPFGRMIRAALSVLEECEGGATPHRHIKLTGDVLPGKTTAGVGSSEGSA